MPATRWRTVAVEVKVGAGGRRARGREEADIDEPSNEDIEKRNERENNTWVSQLLPQLLIAIEYRS